MRSRDSPRAVYASDHAAGVRLDSSTSSGSLYSGALGLGRPIGRYLQGCLRFEQGSYYQGPVEVTLSADLVCRTARSRMSPKIVSGLALWLRGDLGVVASGTSVISWEDQSGNGRHAVQATPGNRPSVSTDPARTINGWPVIDFDGTDDYLTVNAGLGNPSAAEVFIVGRLDADPPGGSGQTGFWTFGSAAQYVHVPWTDGVVYDAFGSTTRKTTVDPTDSLADPFIYNVTTTSSEWTSRLNGTELFTTASNTVGWVAVPQIGASYTAFWLDGTIAEIIIYDHKLTSDERAAVYGYLAARYGLF